MLPFSKTTKSISFFQPIKQFTSLFCLLAFSASVQAGVDLVVNNTDNPDPVSAGGTVTYTIRVDNNGTVDSASTSLIVTLPASGSYLSSNSPDGITCPAPVGSTLTCDVGSLAGVFGTPSNESKTVNILIASQTQGSMLVSATATTTGSEDVPANNINISQSTTVDTGADLTVTKSASAATVQSGGSLSYTLTASNNGPDDAVSIRISDPVPTGFTVTSLPTGCNIVANTIHCDSASLALNASVVFGPITGKVSASSSSNLTNVASIGLQPSAPGNAPLDAISSNNTASVTTTVTAGSDLSISKTRDIVGPFFIGENFNYIISPQYTGDAPNNVTVIDTVPAIFTIGTVTASQNGWTCSVAAATVSCTQAGGGSAGSLVSLGDIIIPVTANATGSATNTASISAVSPTDPNPGNNSANDGGATVQPSTADLAIAKSGPSPALVTSGQAFNYQLTASNNGLKEFFGTLIVTDNLPAGLTLNTVTASGWTCSPALPLVGAAAFTCQRDYTALSPLASGTDAPIIALNVTANTTGTINNSASVSSTGANAPDPNLSNNTTSYQLTSSPPAGSADLEVIKTVVSPLPTNAGELLQYRIELINHSTIISTTVRVNDNLVTLINDQFGAGQGVESVTITPNSAVGTNNCNTSSSGTRSRFLQCNFSSVPVCTQGTDCALIDVFVRPGGSGVAGSDTNYSRNNTARVVSFDIADNNHSNDTSTVNSLVTPRADLAVTKACTPTSVNANTPITCVVTVKNNGPSRANNVAITDTLPNNVLFVSATPTTGSCATQPSTTTLTSGGTGQVGCSLGNLGNGVQQTIQVIFKASNAVQGTIITNNASGTMSTIDNNPGNETAQANIGISPPQLDLVINKKDSIDPVAVGNNTTYTITVQNSGPSDSEDPVVTDTLPAAGLSFISATPSIGSCTNPAVGSIGGTLTCQLSRLAANASATIQVVMKGENKGFFTNAASVSSTEVSNGWESPAGNNTVTEQTTVRTKTDMEVVSKIPSISSPNLRDNFNYTIKVRNNTGLGLAEADNVKLTDTLPAGMELTGPPVPTLVAGTTSLFGCGGSAGAISFTCAFGTVSSGTEVDIIVPVQLVQVNSIPQTFTNTATVNTDSLDINSGNNSNSGNVSVGSSSIAGRVFRDFNADGLISANDNGIPGVPITLTGTTFDGAVVNQIVNTNATGNFIFSGIAQSDGTGYTITEGVPPENYLTDGMDTAGSVGGDAATVNDQISSIVLAFNTAATAYNFAEIPQAHIGIAKRVFSGPTANADSSFNVGFILVVENLSFETLNNIAVDDLLTGAAPLFGNFNAGVLSNGQYQIANAPTGTCSGLQAGFTGEIANKRIASISSLTAGTTCNIQFTLKVKPTAPLPPVLASGGRYENQAQIVSATGAFSAQTQATNPQLTDLSDNGSNVDPNNNGQANEPGENDPTPVNPSFTGAIGIAKQVSGDVTVNADGSLTVPIRLQVSNVGNEPLHTVTISDPLSSAAGGQFGSFVSGGAAATLTSDQYTLQSPPTFSGSCNTGSVVAGFTGHTGNLTLATIINMDTGVSCIIDFSYRFKAKLATLYTNQANADAITDLTLTPVSDLSNDGNNPDPNGNGNAGDPGENTPTPVSVPLIGLAKSAGGVVRIGDGTYTVPFTLTVQNMGATALNTIQINDTLAGALPEFGQYTSNTVPAAGEYTLSSAPVISNQTNGAALTAVAAGVYTGSGTANALLVAASSSLPNFGSNASRAQINFTIRFYPTTAGPFNNSAVAVGSPPGGGTVKDDSVAGSVPDANGNKDPNDDTSPTIVSLQGQRIGVAKATAGIVQTGSKRFKVPYSLIITNTSANVTATNVQLSDDLTTTFPTAVSRIITSPVVISDCTGTVLAVANPAFTGTGQNKLLTGNQNLQPGESCNLSFTTEIDFANNPLPDTAQNNQALATTTQTPGGIVISQDLSNNGNIVDPNANGDPTENGENTPTPVSFTSINLASITGKVYLDSNHDRLDNDAIASAKVSGFLVEVLNAAGDIVANTTTDTNGNYTVNGLFPSTPGNPATRYAIRFREPVSHAIYGLPQSSDPTVTLNGIIKNGIITQLALVSAVTTINQNLPLDPSGVIYDSITRKPVPGAIVSLVVGGATVPTNCLVGGVNPQTTNTNGLYQFILLNPAPPGCPGDGIYTLEVLQPAGYLPPPSAIIPPQAGVHTPGTGGVDAIQAQATAPSGTQPTTYFLAFNLSLGSSANVVNNHIPLDLITDGALTLVKSTPKLNVIRSELVPYTITASNNFSAVLPNIDVVDQIPPGFKYKVGSGRMNNIALEPTVNGRTLTWSNLTFSADEQRNFNLLLIVGSGVNEGKYINQAWAENNIISQRISNIATATVRVIPDPTFDCSDIIGKVFDDKNLNGYPDDGEEMLPGIRLATARGWLVTTDHYGRYHITCAAVPNSARGSNFIIKLDERTLPSGYRITTENPRVVRLTRGKITKANFGAAIHRVVRLDIAADAFELSSSELKPEYINRIDGLLDILKQSASVLRISYLADYETQNLAQDRLQKAKELISEKWLAIDCCYNLILEEELHWRTGEPRSPEKSNQGAK